MSPIEHLSAILRYHCQWMSRGPFLLFIETGKKLGWAHWTGISSWCETFSALWVSVAPFCATDSSETFWAKMAHFWIVHFIICLIIFFKTVADDAQRSKYMMILSLMSLSTRQFISKKMNFKKLWKQYLMGDFCIKRDRRRKRYES